jgi:Tol biopolymer transport system component
MASGSLPSVREAKCKRSGVALANVGGATFQVVYRDSTRNILGPQWSPNGDKIIFGIGNFAAFSTVSTASSSSRKTAPKAARKSR